MKKSFRKNVFLIVFVCMTLFVTSCGKKKPQEGDEEPKKQIDLTEE
jgi:predicted small lipoprotein YifL